MTLQADRPLDIYSGAGLDLSELAELSERRPDWLEERINQDYAAAAGLDPSASYGFNGMTTGYGYLWRGPWGTPDLYIATDELLDAAADRRPPGAALRILDVGCGAGGFVDDCRHQGHDAQGLTACDYRRFPEFDVAGSLSYPAYLVGDAHRLDHIDGVREEYDLIVSRNCLDKLVDPLSVVEQMAGRLALGGVLATDDIWVADRDVEAGLADGRLLSRHVVAAMLDGGFELLDDRLAGYIDHHFSFLDADKKVPPLALRRVGSAPLRFAVEYSDLPLLPGRLATSPVVRYLAA